MDALSVCMTAGRDPARVRAILTLLRPVADEIVLAADARVADAVHAACADLTDRRLSYTFEWPPSRYLGWIHHQCSGDWILRLDDDELPGQDLLDALPSLVADRRRSCIHLPCRHLHPHPTTYLASHPWHPDYHARLVRNVPGLWRFDGRAHTEVDVLGEHRREPAAPFYHLRYVDTPAAHRQATVARYEQRGARPTTEAYPVNALYVPERWTGLQLAAVPERDRRLVDAVMRPAPAPDAAPPWPIEHASAADADRFNASRTVRDDAHRAEIRISPARTALFAGVVAHLEVAVRNLGGERWPAAHHEQPMIRLAYRWLSGDGTRTVVAEGLRTPFTETVEPGEATVVMLAALAPEAPGRYVLEVDVVHELVRWFECEARLPVTVEPYDQGTPDSQVARPEPDWAAPRDEAAASLAALESRGGTGGGRPRS
jgi:hypothetical protein